MKNLAYLVLCFLLPLMGQAQISGLRSESFYLKESPVKFKLDSLLFQEFMGCFLEENNRWQLEELIYLEIINGDGKLNLFDIKGRYSKETNLKLNEALKCLESKQLVTSNLKFILYTYEMQRDSRKKKDHQKVLNEFKEQFSISTEVEVFRVSHSSISCGPAIPLKKGLKNRYLLTSRPYKM